MTYTYYIGYTTVYSGKHKPLNYHESHYIIPEDESCIYGKIKFAEGIELPWVKVEYHNGILMGSDKVEQIKEQMTEEEVFMELL